MTRGLALLAAMTLVACASSQKATGRWTGAITPETAGPACKPSRGVLQIRDGSVIFAPDEGTWILEGVARPDGTLTAEHAQVGANQQVYETTLDARWTPETVTGTYTTPRCRFEVRLIHK